MNYWKIGSVVAVALMLVHPSVTYSQGGLAEFRLCSSDVEKVRDFMSQIFACTRVISDTAQPPEIRSVAFRQRGYAYLMNGPPDALDRIIADYNEAIKLTPTRASLYYDRASARSGVLTLHGKFPGLQEARLMRPDLDMAITLDNSKAEFFSARANANGIIGYHTTDIAHLDQAIIDQSKAVRLIAINKGDVGIETMALGTYHNNRGLVHEKRGNVPSAIADFKRALELDPGHRGAKEALERLTPK